MKASDVQILTADVKMSQHVSQCWCAHSSMGLTCLVTQCSQWVTALTETATAGSWHITNVLLMSCGLTCNADILGESTE